MKVTTTFEYTPGELVDVPHLCIDGGLVRLAFLGPSGGCAYLVQSTWGGKPFDVEVIESAVQPAKEG